MDRIKQDNPELAPLVNYVLEIARAGTSDNTNNQYDFYFKKFSEWRTRYRLTALREEAFTVVSYISSLVSVLV